MISLRRLVACLAAACGTALAQPAPGDYTLEGGGGVLSINPAGPNRATFTLETVGANAHTCALEGAVAGGVAKLEGLDGKPCVVRFRASPAGIDVKADDYGACSGYCGMRATFEGRYVKPAPACTANAMAATRRRFKQQYDAKRFAEARATLEPLLSTCKPVLHWLDEARIRNDLAVTLHKLSARDACRQALAPLAEDARKTDAQIREDYPPTDAESYLPVVRATRTNLRLCASP